MSSLLVPLVLVNLIGTASAAVSPRPSSIAACAAFLGADTSTFAIRSLREDSTRRAYQAFRFVRRQLMGLPTNDRWIRDVMLSNHFTTSGDSARSRARAALRVRGLEVVLEGGDPADDTERVDFTSSNVKAGFVVRGQAAIESYLANVRSQALALAEGEREAFVEDLRAKARLLPFAAGFGAAAAIFPASGIGAGAVFTGAPAVLVALHHQVQIARRFEARLASLGGVARATDPTRWAYLKLQTLADADFIEAQMLGAFTEAGSGQFLTTADAMLWRDEAALEKLAPLVVDALAFTERDSSTGQPTPCLAVMIRYRTPTTPKPVRARALLRLPSPNFR